MSSALEASGAVREPSEYATLSMDRHITGLWTQRSPLRDADVPYLYGKFYSASRFDSLIDGINREITARLTDARRCGSSVWNNNTFPAINSYYSFKYIQDSVNIVRTIVDGSDGTVYDATAGGKTALFSASTGAGRARFLGVGTELFFSNGIDRKKLIRSAKAWKATSSFDGSFVVDTNLNLQLAIGSQTATITNILIDTNVCTLFFDSSTPLTIPIGTKLTFAGLTTVAALNATTQTITEVPNGQQVQFAFTNPDVPFAAETGTATTGDGITGSVEPTWGAGIGTITQDGGEQWECRGASVQDWQGPAPTVAPSVTTALAPSVYDLWAANTWYAPAGFLIVDSNNNLQQLTTGGITGGSAPTWNVTQGGTTTDNTAVWTNKGSATWAANHAYSVGDTIAVTYTYYIQIWVPSGSGGLALVPPFLLLPFLNHLSPLFKLIFAAIYHGLFPHFTPGSGSYESVPVTVSDMFQCTTAGTSASRQPSWIHGVGTTTRDNTVVWTNQGTKQLWPGASAALSLDTKILDSNGNLQQPTKIGETGGTAPTWNTTKGGSTTDSAQSWLNVGPYAAANTGSWTYAFSGLNSITNDVTTASPQTVAILPALGYQPVLQGAGLADTQYDSLIIWRTVQGRSTLVYLDTIPNPGGGETWVYTDTSPDSNLILEEPAPIADANDPPPAGFTGPVYHLQRIWGFVGNIVYYSGGPDTLAGSGNTSFPPLNFIPYPEKVIRLMPVTLPNGGILVFTTTNVYVILGTGTTGNPFYTTLYMGSVGILGYDALTMVGSTFYLMTSTRKFVSLDPSAGYIEAGFPIGDQLKNVTTGTGSAPTGALYDPATAYVTWYEGGSGDTAVYVADGAVGWFRFAPVASPETGYLWSTRAAIAGGTSAVQAVETTAGVTQLLIGPPAGGGKILFRDTTVHTDNGVAYPSWDVKGNIVLCESGEIAEIAHIALKSIAVGAKPTVSLLLGEIAETSTVKFDALAATSEDPPDIPPSSTIYSDRYVAMQNAVCPKCDNFQLKIDYGTQDAADELLKFSIYGAKHAERKQQ